MLLEIHNWCKWLDYRVSFRELSKGGGGGGGATGGTQILKGGMAVIDVTKFHKSHLVGRAMLECVSVCGGGGSYRIGELQSSVLTWRGCIVDNN